MTSGPDRRRPSWQRILRQLPGRGGEIRRQLDHPGPTRLRDVEEARGDWPSWPAWRMRADCQMPRGQTTALRDECK